MNFKKNIVSLGSAALLSMSATVSADSLVIDLFDTNQGDSAPLLLPNLYIDNTADGVAVGGSVSGAGVLGVERDLYVNQASNDGSSTFVSAGVSGGKFNFGVNPGSFGSATVQWDGADNSGDLAFGLGDLDFSGYTDFEIVTSSSDLGFEFLLGVYTSATVYTEITILSHFVAPGSDAISDLQIDTFSIDALHGLCSAPGGLDNPFGATNVINMTCGGGGVADLEHVNALQLIIDPNAVGISGNGAIDLQLKSAHAVPEPTSLALLGMGLIAAGAMRRRKTA